LVVAHEVQLRGAGRRIDDAIGVAYLDARDGIAGLALRFLRILRALRTLRGSRFFRGRRILRRLVQRRLARDPPRVLVRTQPVEDRVAHAALAGPFGERDLGDELGLYPVALHLARLVGEGRSVGLERGELLLHRAQQLLVEAGADVARVAQLAVGVVDAEQQRAESRAASFRVGVAADHELLAPRALQLDPRARAFRDVRRV